MTASGCWLFPRQSPLSFAAGQKIATRRQNA
jgi:hypothetical protein